MENDFRIKKINATEEEVEFHNNFMVSCLRKLTRLRHSGDNWNKFISTLDAKKFKTEQN